MPASLGPILATPGLHWAPFAPNFDPILVHVSFTGTSLGPFELHSCPRGMSRGKKTQQLGAWGPSRHRLLFLLPRLRRNLSRTQNMLPHGSYFCRPNFCQSKDWATTSPAQRKGTWLARSMAGTWAVGHAEGIRQTLVRTRCQASHGFGWPEAWSVPGPLDTRRDLETRMSERDVLLTTGSVGQKPGRHLGLGHAGGLRPTPVRKICVASHAVG